MRTKTIELDGAKFTIAPLTLREVEEFVGKQKDALEMPEGTAREKQFTQLWREFLSMGFNNVHRGEDGNWPEPKPKLVDPGEIPDRLDLVSLQRLRDELLEFSGLRKEG
jgi:hypothetical protein